MASSLIEMSKETAKVTPFNVVFCDDIRREISGKEIIIGAYSADIVIYSVPVMLGFALWIQFRLSGQGRRRYKIKITDPAGNQSGETQFDIAINPNGPATGALSMPPLPVSITMLGKIIVWWAEDGSPYKKIGEKKVIMSSVPAPQLQVIAEP